MKTRIDSPRPAAPLHRVFPLLAMLLVIYSAGFSWHSWHEEKKAQIHHLQNIMEIGEKAVDKYLSEIEQDMNELSHTFIEEDGAIQTEDAFGKVRRFLNFHKDLVNVTVIREDGRILFSGKSGPGEKHATLASEPSFIQYRNELQKGMPMSVGQPLIGRTTRQWIIPLRCGVKDREGRLRYIVSAGLPIDILQNFWKNAPLTKSASLGLIRDDGFFVSRYPVPDKIEMEKIYGAPRTGVLISHLKKEGFPVDGHVEGKSGIEGSNFLFAFQRLEHFPMTLFVAMPVSEIRLGWWGKVRVPMALSLLILLGGWLIYRSSLHQEKILETEKWQVNQKLEDLNSFLDSIIEHSPISMWISDSNGTLIRANQALRNLFLTGDKTIVGKYCIFEDRQIEEQGRMPLVREVYENGRTVRFSMEYDTDPGEEPDVKPPKRVSLDVTISAVRDADGTVIHAIIQYLDVTEQKKTEAALTESEKKYRLIANHTADTVWILDMNLRFTYVSPSVQRMYGHTEEEVTGRTIDESVTPESLQVATEAFMEEMVLEAGGAADPDRIRVIVLEEYKHDRSTIWVESSMSFLRDENGKAIGILGVSRDVTDRKKTEDALRESEEKFRLTFSFSPDAVTISRLSNGQYVDINDGFSRTMGFSREDVIGKTSLEIGIWPHPSDRLELLQELREKGVLENLEIQFRKNDGGMITALMSVRVISLKGEPHIISIVRDITERKLMATKLQQAQKLEAIGTLAGGIAHDFNNLLMGIQGHVSLMSLDIRDSHPHLEHVRAIEEYTRSAASLTKQLLGYAQGGKYEIMPIDLKELVFSSSALFGRTRKEIQIRMKSQDGLFVVDADRGQIEQVLLNLYVNAWQAMPPEGGDIYLDIRNISLDETQCKPHDTVPGRYVKISITDTGCGMDDATMRQIFDPFFTTKEKSRGTGLGLASAYGIIKNHGGMITVYSEIGHGSSFNIYLPASGRKPFQEISKETEPFTANGTILLVDDEEMIIEVGQAMLEKLGYRVLVCRSGNEAVQIVSNQGDEIDLVILDMIMPGMDGGSTFDQIRQIQSEIPVLLSSGYAINGQADKILRRGCNGFIQKPYSISDLSNKVYPLLKRKRKD